MAAVGLSHYNIRVPSEKLEEIKKFYCEIVGLVQGPRPPFKSFGYWLYARDEAIVHLVESTAGKDPEVTTSTTVDHFAFECSDFEGMKNILETSRISYKFTTVPERNLRQLVFKDPLDNGVELVFPQEGD